MSKLRLRGKIPPWNCTSRKSRNSPSQLVCCTTHLELPCQQARHATHPHGAPRDPKANARYRDGVPRDLLFLSFHRVEALRLAPLLLLTASALASSWRIQLCLYFLDVAQISIHLQNR